NFPPSRHCRSFVSKLFLFGCAFLRCRFRCSFPGRASPARAAFRALRSILGATTPAPINTERVERAAHNVVAYARQIFHSPAAHEHDGVLLQVVPLTRNV